MELFVTSRNHQCVEITVQIVRSIRIRAIKDDRERIVRFLNIAAAFRSFDQCLPAFCRFNSASSAFISAISTFRSPHKNSSLRKDQLSRSHFSATI